MTRVRNIPFFVAAWILTASHPLSAAPVSYRQDIVPILKANCVSCHRPAKLKGGLDLSSFESFKKGGKHGSPFQPGAPSKSRVIQAVSGPEPEMPLEGEPLTRLEIKTLTAWINQGAKEDSSSDNKPDESSQPPDYAALPAISSLAFSPDGTLLAVAGRAEVLLYSGDGTELRARLSFGAPRIESLCFSKDGAQLAISGGSPYIFGQIQLWSTATRHCLQTIRASTDVFHGISLSDDATKAAVGGSDKRVYVFNSLDGKVLSICDNHFDWVLATAFSHDGKHLASGGRDKAVKLVDTSTGRLIDDLARPRDVVLAMARHPSEDWVAYTGEEGRVRLHKIAPRGGRLKEGDDREESALREFESMGTKLHAVAFNATGSILACGGENGEIRAFNTANGQRTFNAKLSNSVFALAFHPDGKTLVAAGIDGRLHFLETVQGKTLKSIDSVPLKKH